MLGVFVLTLDPDCWAAAEIKCSCCLGEGLSVQVCGQISCFVSNGLFYFIQVSWKEVKALSDKWFSLKVPGELKETQLEAVEVCRLGSLGKGSRARRPLAAGADEMLQPWEWWDSRLVLPWLSGEPRGTHSVLPPSLPLGCWGGGSDSGSPLGYSLKAVGSSGFWQSLQEHGI